MADIAPELYDKIKEIFDQKYAQAQMFGSPLASVFDEIKAGTATLQTADLYAVEVGSMMADSMKEVLKLDELPGGRLYRNIAQKTIGEGLKDTYGLVSNISATIQEEINGRNNIGLKAVKPKLETDRVDKIVNRAVNAKTQTALDNNLTDTVPTFVRQVADDTQKANARLHNKAGLAGKVEREYDGVGLHDGEDACQWCLDRAGTWTYDKALANGVFERHEGCGCIITYTSAKGEVTRSVDRYNGFSPINNPEEQETMLLKNDINTEAITKELLNSGIEYKEVKPLEKPLTTEEIIEKIGEKDPTKGSCVPQALAYLGNKAGWDVRDYRGGESEKFFAENGNLIKIAQMDGVNYVKVRNTNDYTAAEQLKKKIKKDKEYIFSVGQHTAIVRKNGTKIEYLELQRSKDNGFKPLNNKSLSDRFNCKKSHSVYGVPVEYTSELIDVNTLLNNSEFKKILGFINNN